MPPTARLGKPIIQVQVADSTLQHVPPVNLSLGSDLQFDCCDIFLAYFQLNFGHVISPQLPQTLKRLVTYFMFYTHTHRALLKSRLSITASYSIVLHQCHVRQCHVIMACTPYGIRCTAVQLRHQYGDGITVDRNRKPQPLSLDGTVRESVRP